MIEFNGCISGAAERHFWKKVRALGHKVLVIVFALLFPIMLYITLARQLWILMLIYAAMLAYCLLLTYIPKSKKEKAALLPVRIYTEEDYIVCITGNGVEDYRQMADAKQVIDHGEFYEIVFPMGKVSEKFICQKDLLSKGTTEEFEALFSCERVRKYPEVNRR